MFGTAPADPRYQEYASGRRSTSGCPPPSSPAAPLCHDVAKYLADVYRQAALGLPMYQAVRLSPSRSPTIAVGAAEAAAAAGATSATAIRSSLAASSSAAARVRQTTATGRRPRTTPRCDRLRYDHRLADSARTAAGDEHHQRGGPAPTPSHRKWPQGELTSVPPEEAPGEATSPSAE